MFLIHATCILFIYNTELSIKLTADLYYVNSKYYWSKLVPYNYKLKKKQVIMVENQKSKLIRVCFFG